MFPLEALKGSSTEGSEGELLANALTVLTTFARSTTANRKTGNKGYECGSRV